MNTMNSGTTALVQVADLSFFYGERVLWNNVSFEVRAGEALAVVGESGTGKTTMLQCMGGLEKPTSGSVRINGASPSELKGKAKREFLRSTVGYAFQGFGVVASKSVKYNLEIAGFRVDRNINQVHSLFDKFGLPHEFLTKPVYELSGGEQQRVALVRLALQDPHVLLMDEPTAALDDANAMLVTDFIRNHCERGGSAIVVTHDARVYDKADKVLRL